MKLLSEMTSTGFAKFDTQETVNSGPNELGAALLCIYPQTMVRYCKSQFFISMKI